MSFSRPAEVCEAVLTSSLYVPPNNNVVIQYAFMQPIFICEDDKIANS